VKCTLLVVAFAALASVLAPESASSQSESDRGEEFWRDSESVAFADARATGRHVIVVFGAEWCVPCRKIEQIMNDDIVLSLISVSFVPLHFDITELTDRDEALQAKYRVPVLPAVIFMNVTGQELGRWNKNLSAGGFLAAMRRVMASHPPRTD
jgi:thiol:disulfide interchange protein